MSLTATPLTEALGIEVPLICGAMYPCSNPELIAAVSEAVALASFNRCRWFMSTGWSFAKAFEK